MVAVTLDSIVRKVILNKGSSLHFYMQMLVHAAEILKELTFDDLKVINTKKLTVNSYNAIDIPTDLVDVVSVNIQVGQLLRPLVPQDSINSLHNYDSSFNVIRYDEQNDESDEETLYYQPVPSLRWDMVTTNDFGENIGRYFGLGAGEQWDTYKLIKERNQIQLSEAIEVDYIFLEYISNGMSVDAATQVDPYAEATIIAYINWKLKEYNRSYGVGEVMAAKQEYIEQRRVLRARKNPLTISLIKRIVQKNSKASIKG